MIPENSETYLGLDLSTQKVNDIEFFIFSFRFIVRYSSFISSAHAPRITFSKSFPFLDDNFFTIKRASVETRYRN